MELGDNHRRPLSARDSADHGVNGLIRLMRTVQSRTRRGIDKSLGRTFLGITDGDGEAVGGNGGDYVDMGGTSSNDDLGLSGAGQAGYGGRQNSVDGDAVEGDPDSRETLRGHVQNDRRGARGKSGEDQGDNRSEMQLGAGDSSSKENARDEVERKRNTASGLPRRNRGNMGTGRLKVRWGVDVDVEVPLFVESLIKGPWDPRGEVWGRQVDMACEVIRRSGGVVFAEQLAPVLNPPLGPRGWAVARETSGSADSGTGEPVNFADEAFVVRLLTELEGKPEVTEDGDILYVFPGLTVGNRRTAGGGAQGSGLTQPSEAEITELRDGGSARPEVMVFEEVPKTLESLAKIPKEGTKAVMQFAQRAALAGFSLFLTIILLLGQLILGAWPTWTAIGPTYLAWVAADDVLRRSRYDSARERDRWRNEWADYVSLEDSDVVWRKRGAARRRAKSLPESI